jgi:hypothetical protein
MNQLDETLLDLPAPSLRNTNPPDPEGMTAIQLVPKFGGFGVHTLLSLVRNFPMTFKNVIFVSVGVIDSGSFKGHKEMEALEESVKNSLQKYVELAQRLGFRAGFRMTLGTDVVESAVDLVKKITEEFPSSMVFTGQLTFLLEKFYHRILHNETAFAIQRHLHWSGITTIILPIRVKL